jgi:hypothetical protein
VSRISDTKRLQLGVVTAVVVLAIGVAQVASVAWAVVVAACAIGLVSGAVLLGNRLGARRAGGN